MKNKLLFLTLISVISNSFSFEENFDKEFTVVGIVVFNGIEGGVYLIQDQRNPEIYYRPKNNKDFSKFKNDTYYKFILKKRDIVSAIMKGIPVEVISFEEIERQIEEYEKEFVVEGKIIMYKDQYATEELIILTTTGEQFKPIEDQWPFEAKLGLKGKFTIKKDHNVGTCADSETLPVKVLKFEETKYCSFLKSIFSCKRCKKKSN